MKLDPDKAEAVRAELRAMLASNPSPQKAALAQKTLNMLRPENHTPPEHSDEELGIENKPIGDSRWDEIANEGDTGGRAAREQADIDNRSVAVRNKTHKYRPQTELEADPVLQEGVSTALTMPVLHKIGTVLARGGSKLAEMVAPRLEPDMNAVLKTGAHAGKTAQQALDDIERLEQGMRGEKSTTLERQKEDILDQVTKESAAPGLNHLHGVHLSPYARLLMAMPGVAGGIAQAGGNGLAAPSTSFIMSPIMQAVMGSPVQPPAKLPDSPELPGGTK